jgi:predicted esterase YcpF (UPF0227 family)
MRTATLLVYLHGFRSSPASIKARQLGQAVAALPDADRPTLSVPELDHRPAYAMMAILARVAGIDASTLTFVGSSLGGFYATYAAERLGARAVLINPAIRPDEDLRPYRGGQVNLHTGAGFEVTDAHFAALAALRVARITRPDRYLLLVQAGDEVLDYRQAVAFYAGAWQRVEGGGDHGFAGFEAQIPLVFRFAGAR